MHVEALNILMQRSGENQVAWRDDDETERAAQYEKVSMNDAQSGVILEVVSTAR